MNIHSSVLRCHSSATPSHSRLARPVAAPAGDLGRRHQAGDLRGGRRRRVAAGLLPALLRRRRPRTHQRVRGLAHAAPDAVVRAPQLIRQDDRERRLVELDVALIRLPVDLRVLRERPVRLLLVREQPGHRPVRRGPVTRREQAGDLVVEVTRPHEVIATAALVGVHGEPPRQRQRRDEGAAERLVLVGLDRHDRDVVLRAQPLREHRRSRPQRPEVAAPLLPVRRRAVGEALHHAAARRQFRRPLGAAEPKRQHMLCRGPDARIDGELAGLQDVAVRRRVVVEVQLEVLLEVGPAVARPDESVRRPDEAVIRHQRRVRVPLAREQCDVADRCRPATPCHHARSC